MWNGQTMVAKPKARELSHYDKATIRVMLDAARAIKKRQNTQKVRTQIAILTVEYAARRA